MRRYPTIIFLAALLGVAACAKNKTAQAPVIGKALNSIQGMHDETQVRLATEAHNAIAEGKIKEALVFHGKMFKDNPRDEENALNYAQLLRKNGETERSLKVLSRFVNSRDGKLRGSAAPVMLNEYAAASIEAGKYDLAEEALNKVLEDDKATAHHADADNLLGLVLDAQNKHKEAEQYYRQALDGWKGDNSAVLNNLGLCLAAQGRLDESLTSLRQALVKAPKNEEIARNIRMVANLSKALTPTAPISVTGSSK